MDILFICTNIYFFYLQVSVNGLDKAGCTALHWAAHAGNEECVRELLKMSNIQINVQVCIHYYYIFRTVCSIILITEIFKNAISFIKTGAQINLLLGSL